VSRPEPTGPGARVLVVEDESYVRESLVAMLASRGFEVSAAASLSEAEAELQRSPVDVVLSDLRMPGGDGLELVSRFHESLPELPVVILTGHGTVASAVECLKAGASDYILKPADPEALEVALERALDARSLRRELRYLRQDASEDAGSPAGESDAWRKVMAMVDAAARTDSIVLLAGESGTGKELLARRLHDRSERAPGPFVRVNCAAVPVEMWESEFFGHRRGSFMNATDERDGRFLLAHRGMLLLDEVSATPAGAQAKLLRAIQEGEFERLGDSRPTRVDVRILATTNSNLEQEVQKGRFRADLFYRLNVVRINVPPLRERHGDVPLLAGRFAEEIAAKLGRPVPTLSAETLGRLSAYSWPGNVRELKSVIERALVLDPVAGLEVLDILPGPGDVASASQGQPASGDLNLRTALTRLERELLAEAVKRSRGVRKEAARLLGIDPRNLAYYVKKHGLPPGAGEE
jgi:DNA-binding NtrC family response regulator